MSVEHLFNDKLSIPPEMLERCVRAASRQYWGTSGKNNKYASWYKWHLLTDLSTDHITSILHTETARLYPAYIMCFRSILLKRSLDPEHLKNKLGEERARRRAQTQTTEFVDPPPSIRLQSETLRSKRKLGLI